MSERLLQRAITDTLELARKAGAAGSTSVECADMVDSLLMLLQRELRQQERTFCAALVQEEITVVHRVLTRYIDGKQR